LIHAAPDGAQYLFLRILQTFRPYASEQVTGYSFLIPLHKVPAVRHGCSPIDEISPPRSGGPAWRIDSVFKPT
jgi:hypothetical protein